MTGRHDDAEVPTITDDDTIRSLVRLDDQTGDTITNSLQRRSARHWRV